jgi:hypothetical protein
MSADQLSPERRRGNAPILWYYRNGEVAVTSRSLLVGTERYAIAELTDLMRARGPMHPGVTIGAATAAIQAPLLLPLAVVSKSALVWVAAVVLLVIPGVIAFICAKRRPPKQELIARYQGREVILFASRDEREFGQVSRAVWRAVEALPER